MVRIESNSVYSGHKNSIYKILSWNHDSQFISLSGDGCVVLWELGHEDGHLIAQVPSQIFTGCKLYMEGLLVLCDMSGHIYLIDTKEKKTLKSLLLHKGSIFACKVLNEKYFMTAGQDGVLKLCSTDTCRPVLSIQLSIKSLRSIAFNYNLSQVFVGSSDGNIYILNSDSFELIDIIKAAHDNSVFCLLQISPTQLVSGGRDAHLNMYEENNSWIKIKSLPAHWFTINDVVMIRGTSDYLVTASRDKTLRLWHADNLNLIQTLRNIDGGHQNSINSLLYLPLHKMLLSAGDDRLIKSWQMIEEY